MFVVVRLLRMLHGGGAGGCWLERRVPHDTRTAIGDERGRSCVPSASVHAAVCNSSPVKP